MDLDTKWNIVAASVAGLSHEKSGMPCQDSHFYIQQDILLVAAVADGAGSASKAEIGSHIAARIAVQKIADLLSVISSPTDHVLEAAVNEGLLAARASLEREAQERSIRLRDLATTLVIFVASEDRIVAAQVGDGAIVALSTDNEVFSVTIPPRGEYINETIFLSSDNWSESIQSAIYRKRIKGVAAFSDGLQFLALKLPEGTPYEPFFRPLFGLVLATPDGDVERSQLQSFLNSPRVNERTDDDKTLLLAGLR